VKGIKKEYEKRIKKRGIRNEWKYERRNKLDEMK